MEITHSHEQKRCGGRCSKSHNGHARAQDKVRIDCLSIVVRIVDRPHFRFPFPFVIFFLCVFVCVTSLHVAPILYPVAIRVQTRTILRELRAQIETPTNRTVDASARARTLSDPSPFRLDRAQCEKVQQQRQGCRRRRAEREEEPEGDPRGAQGGIGQGKVRVIDVAGRGPLTTPAKPSRTRGRRSLDHHLSADRFHQTADSSIDSLIVRPPCD